MKAVKGCLILTLVLVFSATAFAGDNLHFAIGAKYWLADWTWRYVNSSGETVTLDPVSGKMIGGTLAGKSGKLGCNLTAFIGSGWTWEDDYAYYVYYPGYPVDDYYEGIYEDKMKRTDIIFVLSYNILPQLSLFAGYKSVTYNETYYDEWYQEIYDINGNIDPLYTGNYYIDEDYEYSGSGMGGGIGFSLPLTQNRQLSLYGNVGYFDLGGDLDSGDTILEGGLNYVLGRSLALSGGYRYESYEEDIKINGITVGLSYFK